MNKKFARLSTPYLYWLYILALFPALFMFVLMFLDIPEGLDVSNGLKFTLDNFKQLTEPSTLIAFGNSFLYAFIATILSIVFGYLVAFRLFRSKFKNKFLVLVILILPMWTNILLRTESLAGFLNSNGNVVLSLLGIESADFDLLGTPFAVIFGLFVTYVPFMVMPIFNSLEKIDKSIEEAALDLGLTHTQKFFKVILPMSSKGIVTGSIMVFLPCLSGFAIPEILGRGNIVLIGNVIEASFKNMSYTIGSLLAVIILVVILLSIFVVSKIDKEGETLL
ncbi:MAG: ABC transporter permease [Erysipelotrichaceae bacterium]|nr:ABC transporter permease [Erysipelotrichaceae bacterium]